MIKIFRDKFLSRSIVVSILIVIFLIGGGYLFITYKFKMYQSEELLKYANVLGVAIKNEENIEDIVEVALEGTLVKENVEEGLKYLNRYGYFEGMDIENKWIGNTFIQIRNVTLKMALIFVSCICIEVIYIIYGLIKRIHVASESLEKLAVGQAYEPLTEIEEGVIGTFYHRCNLVSARMNYWIDEVTEERNRLKELLSELSHQLKTPIASIKMNNELILEGYVEKEEEKEFLEINNANIDRMEWIATGLIRLASLESKSITLNKEELNLKETVIDSINSIYGKALKKILG